MIDLNDARDFIKKVEERSRSLEVEKAKLEQQKEYTEKSLKENTKKMAELGCTPDNIDDEIKKLSSSAVTLRSRLETKLSGADKGDN